MKEFLALIAAFILLGIGGGLMLSNVIFGLDPLFANPLIDLGMLIFFFGLIIIAFFYDKDDGGE